MRYNKWTQDKGRPLLNLKFNECHFPLWGNGEKIGKYCGKIVCDKGNQKYCSECYSRCHQEGTAFKIKIPRETNVSDSFLRKRTKYRDEMEKYRFNWD